MKLRILHISILLAGIVAGILLTSAVPGHLAAASSKQAYKTDIVYQSDQNARQPMQQRVQSLLDERSSEGWELVSISAWPEAVANGSGVAPSVNVVLVFKR